MKLGALDFIVKPVIPDELLITLQQALKKPAAAPVAEVVRKDAPAAPLKLHFVKGTSAVAKTLYKQAELVAPTNMSVIIEGESGTGKEHVAKLIHDMSKRKDKPFIAVDCGALSREIAQSELFGHIKGSFTGAMNNKTGQIEAANGGTIFLDEIGNLPYEIQVQLLRALQERKIKRVGDVHDREVDVRIIVATNENLKKAIREGRFREDLFHRLNEFAIAMPALRHRKEDIPDLVHSFLAASNEELSKDLTGVEDEAMEMLMQYSWPGNIRELRNIVKRAVLLSPGSVLSKSGLPADLLDDLTDDINDNPEAASTEMSSSSPVYDLKSLHTEREREIIRETLIANKYNKSKTAKDLNIDRKTLYAKIQKYNIDA
jgi:two-component system response regulator HydG